MAERRIDDYFTPEQSKNLLFDIFIDGIKNTGHKIKYEECAGSFEATFNEIKDDVLDSLDE